MESFLHQVASHIVEAHPDNTDRALVVFSNRRSLRFFAREFASLGRTMFLPQMMAVDDLIAQLGGLKVIPSEFLLFELYTIHRELEGEESKYQSFDEFIAFGDLMLGDFSELDQYCVDARALFDNLHDLKAIGEWDIEGATLTEMQQRYLHFYRSLYDYYRLLRQRLQERGLAYSGMAYRHVAEQIADLCEKVDAEKVYFVGFNALSECERRIAGEFVRRGRGELIVDGDSYFMSPEQEAGHFLRKHVAQFPTIRPPQQSLFAEETHQITIVECPENLLQSKFAGQLLEQHPEWLSAEAGEHTAVVLADETLLLPTLNSLPEGDYSVNISMGYSFRDSNMHLLAMRLLELHATATSQGYHHTELVEALSDRYIGRLLGDTNLRSHTERWLRREGIVRCKGSALRAHLGGYDDPHGLFADAPLDAEQWLRMMQGVMGDIVEQGLLDQNRKERQAAGSLAEIIAYLLQLQEEYHYITSLEVLQKIYSRIARHHQVALLGEPLSGLQVMGMLETRNLDFDRVILLSAGEGVLPAGRSRSSLIPFDLKRHFGLPTYEEKDSVYAYNFYHLLLRAREATLVFSSQSEAMGKGEPSRFLRQVESELAPRFGIEVKHIVVGGGDAPKATPQEGVGVAKSELIMQRLRSMANSSLSPTGFEDYIACPLSYYYTRVLKIRRSDELDDDLDASQVGTCIHNILQRIYEPWVGQEVTSDLIAEAAKSLPQWIEEEFAQHFLHGRGTEGRNHFLRSVATAQLRALLAREEAWLREGHQMTLIAVEQTLPKVLICTDQEGRPVYLSGKADRIDRVDGQVRVVDYKTGSVTEADLTFRTTPNRNGEIPIPGKWFQLMCYALLYSEAYPLAASESMQIGIYPLRHLQAGVQLATFDGSPQLGRQEIDYFRRLLTECCCELMDASQPFPPTTRKSDCRYCDARTFCPLHP